MSDLDTTISDVISNAGVADAADDAPEESLDDTLARLMAEGADGEGDGEAVEGDSNTTSTEPEVNADGANSEVTADGANSAEPDQLSPEDKAFLESLPEKHRQAAEKWRGDLKRGAQEKFEAAAEARKELEEIDRHLGAHGSAELKARGATRAQLFASMTQTLQNMGQDPVGAIEQLAGVVRNSGAGPEQAAEVVRRVATALGVNTGTAGKPAAGDAASQRIAALEQRLRSYETAQEQAQRQQVEAVRSSAAAKIQEFATAKDERGQARHPHFEKVKATVGALMQAAAHSGEQLTLDQAYDRAVWAREDLRDDLMKARQAAAAKAAAATRNNSVARARAAATPRTAAGKFPIVEGKEDLSIDALLSRGLAEMQA